MLQSHLGKILQTAQERVSKPLTLRSTGAVPNAHLLLCVHVCYPGQKVSDVFFIRLHSIQEYSLDILTKNMLMDLEEILGKQVGFKMLKEVGPNGSSLETCTGKGQ